MSPTITKADAAMLGRRAQQPTRQPGELLAVFVSGTLKNPLNASYGWVAKASPRYRREWKERVALVIYEALAPLPPRHTPWPATAPKVVTFHANTHNAMDSDGLQASLKPVRDALVECGVISGDADRDGHVFHYSQQIDRKNRGVVIRVSLAPGDRP